jgi:hypothetical protein
MNADKRRFCWGNYIGFFAWACLAVSALAAAGAQLLTVDVHSDVSRDLELYTIR